MTRLLISVRDAREAITALESGADLIDVKEPHRGPLGAADAATIAEIAQAVSDRVPVSVAFGELMDLPAKSKLLLPSGVRYAKVGLAGCAKLGDWRQRWAAFVDQLPERVSPVAVVYADSVAQSPPAAAVIEEAHRLKCAAVLVDTWDKHLGPLLIHWTIDEIRSFVLAVQQQGMLAVLGGKLRTSSIEQIRELCPDFIAVRGAACLGDRTGAIDGLQVRRLKDLVLSMAAA